MVLRLGFGVQGLGFGVWREGSEMRRRSTLGEGLGLRICLGFGVWGLGFGVWSLEFGFWNLGSGVWGVGLGRLGVKQVRDWGFRFGDDEEERGPVGQ